MRTLKMGVDQKVMSRAPAKVTAASESEGLNYSAELGVLIMRAAAISLKHGLNAESFGVELKILMDSIRKSR